MLKLTEHPEPPIHLILGSDTVSRIRQADTERNREMEAWLSVSLSSERLNPVRHSIGGYLLRILLLE